MSGAPAKHTLTSLLAIAFAFTLPLDGLRVSGGRSLPFLVGIAFVAAVIASWTLVSRIRPAPVGTLLPALFYLLLTLASYFWSINQDLTFTSVVSLFSASIPLLLLVPYLVIWRRAVLTGYWLGAVLLSVLVLSAPANSLTGRRTAVGNENDIAFYLLLAIVVAAYFSWFDRPKQGGALYLLSILPLAMSVTATGSRSAVGALLFSGAFLFLLRLKRRRGGEVGTRRLGFFAAFALLVYLGLTAIPDQYRPDRLGGAADALGRGDLSERQVYWRAIAEDMPRLLGNGFGTTPDLTAGVANQGSVAHSVLFGTWFELGLIGFVVVGWIFARATRGFMSDTWRPLVLLVLPGAVAAMATLTIEPRRLFWLYIVIFLAAQLAATKEISARTTADPSEEQRTLGTARA